MPSAKKRKEKKEKADKLSPKALHASGTDGSLGIAGLLLCQGGDVPAGQAVPDNTGSKFYGAACHYSAHPVDPARQPISSNQVTFDAHRQQSTEIVLWALAKSASTNLVGGAARNGELLRVLSGKADGNNEEITRMNGLYEHDPIVCVRPAGGTKGDGVFAVHDIAAGAFVTSYPCGGLAIPKGGAGNSISELIVAPFRFPMLAMELNLNYGVNIPFFGQDGRQVQLIGDKSQRHHMACGHLMNDSHTVQELGGARQYIERANGNCKPEYANGSLIMRTKRLVRKGEELTYNYGPGYWMDKPKNPHWDTDCAVGFSALIQLGADTYVTESVSVYG